MKPRRSCVLEKYSIPELALTKTLSCAKEGNAQREIMITMKYFFIIFNLSPKPHSLSAAYPDQQVF